MNKLYCQACSENCLLSILKSGSAMLVEGNNCPEGEAYAEARLSEPGRILTTTVHTNFPDVPVISVKSTDVIAEAKLSKVMNALGKVIVDTELEIGSAVVEDVADTGVSIIITSPALMQLGAEFENNNEKLSSAGAASQAKYDVADVEEVRIEGIDDLGADSVGGFVGAAGEAVGVEEAHEDEEEKAAASGKGSKEKKQKGRARIKRF